MNKVCTKCNLEKPLTAYHKDRTINGGYYPSCKECKRAVVNSRVHTEHYKQHRKLYIEANKAKYRALDNARYYRDKDKRLNAVLAYQARPEIKSRRKEYKQTYYKINRGRLNSYYSTRTRYKQQTRVSWTEVDEIAKFYHECPEGYQVDHIIPLYGETATGLHVLSNLQYLPKITNIKKRNKLLDCYLTTYPACDIAVYRGNL